MFFLKDIKAELLDDPKFRSFYEAECHGCITTMALVSRLEEMGDAAGPLLNRLGISLASFENCPRSRNIGAVICKKEGRCNGRL